MCFNTYVACIIYLHDGIGHNVNLAQQFPQVHIMYKKQLFHFFFFINSIIYLWYPVSFSAGA